MSKLNRMANTKNSFQGDYKRVLCVCSAGLLRSPTAALVLSKPPFNFNTRACGVSSEYALIAIDDVLITWADEIVVMEDWQVIAVKQVMKGLEQKPIICLDIEDSHPYRDKRLQLEIKNKYKKATT